MEFEGSKDSLNCDGLDATVGNAAIRLTITVVLDSAQTLRACLWPFLRSGLARLSANLFEGAPESPFSGPIIAYT
jgi:hypothetical protein